LAGTGEGSALDVATLVGDGYLPDARLVRLEYGTVSFVDLLQRAVVGDAGGRDSRNQDVLRLGRYPKVSSGLIIKILKNISYNLFVFLFSYLMEINLTSYKYVLYAMNKIQYILYAMNKIYFHKIKNKLFK